MRGAFGDVQYSIDDGYLIIHTDGGDVMIGQEELQELRSVIDEVLEDE